MLDGENIASKYDGLLAPYAQKNQRSLGREFPHVPDKNRLPFQRDRDRILHSHGFRRLKGKMQVVTPDFGDHFRNRLTHSLEVSHIARDIARDLSLNEDLVETIALAHDLGHPPFGHAGEEALNLCLKKYGSYFDHNKQSLRIVTKFERKYPDFPGLNLSVEVLEGLQKHEKTLKRKDGTVIYWPSLECQLVDLADEIAYIAADLDDGFRGGFFAPEDLSSLKICEYLEGFCREGDLCRVGKKLLVRAIIRLLISQLTETSRAHLIGVKSVEEVQKSEVRFVAFTPDFYKAFLELKRFLFEYYYFKPEVRVMSDQGQKIITDIFEFLENNPGEIPVDFFPDEVLERRICDYIAGMTDDFCRKFWEKNCK